jgi:aryl-alcohol dehydrogenase-like predicted oxidoreductase
MAMPCVALAPGLQVSRLCLGTMTYGEQNTFEDACDQLNMATETGINFFDTAEMYPVPQRAETQGRTEEYVGRWLKQSKYSRDHVVLATKVPFLVDSRNFLSLGMHMMYFEAELMSLKIRILIYILSLFVATGDDPWPARLDLQLQ